MNPAPDLHAQSQRLVDFFQALSPRTLQNLGDFYSPDAFFKDPYQEVRGLAPIGRVFAHMYEVLDEPRFVIVDQLASRSPEGVVQCFFNWDFHFRFKRFQPQQAQWIHGSSHLKLTPAGLVHYHRDYWDTSEEVYEKLPLLGSLMRWLKKQARAA
ncbi:MAG: nuclear transport factor 2 family protein [Burkholderiaceae bacterium]